MAPSALFLLLIFQHLGYLEHFWVSDTQHEIFSIQTSLTLPSVYQTYYESGDLYTETSSNISWIGSVQAFCVLLVGAFVGPVYDRGYLRSLLIVGTFFMVVGM